MGTRNQAAIDAVLQQFQVGRVHQCEAPGDRDVWAPDSTPAARDFSRRANLVTVGPGLLPLPRHLVEGRATSSHEVQFGGRLALPSVGAPLGLRPGSSWSDGLSDAESTLVRKLVATQCDVARMRPTVELLGAPAAQRAMAFVGAEILAARTTLFESGGQEATLDALQATFARLLELGLDPATQVCLNRGYATSLAGMASRFVDEACALLCLSYRQRLDAVVHIALHEALGDPAAKEAQGVGVYRLPAFNNLVNYAAEAKHQAARKRIFRAVLQDLTVQLRGAPERVAVSCYDYCYSFMLGAESDGLKHVARKNTPHLYPVLLSFFDGLQFSTSKSFERLRWAVSFGSVPAFRAVLSHGVEAGSRIHGHHPEFDNLETGPALCHVLATRGKADEATLLEMLPQAIEAGADARALGNLSVTGLFRYNKVFEVPYALADLTIGDASTLARMEHLPKLAQALEDAKNEAWRANDVQDDEVASILDDKVSALALQHRLGGQVQKLVADLEEMERNVWQINLNYGYSGASSVMDSLLYALQVGLREAKAHRGSAGGGVTLSVEARESLVALQGYAHDLRRSLALARSRAPKGLPLANQERRDAFAAELAAAQACLAGAHELRSLQYQRLESAVAQGALEHVELVLANTPMLSLASLMRAYALALRQEAQAFEPARGAAQRIVRASTSPEAVTALFSVASWLGDERAAEDVLASAQKKKVGLRAFWSEAQASLLFAAVELGGNVLGRMLDAVRGTTTLAGWLQATNEAGDTVYHAAARTQGNASKLLIKALGSAQAKAACAAVNIDGRLPLHEAIAYRNLEGVRALWSMRKAAFADVDTSSQALGQLRDEEDVALQNLLHELPEGPQLVQQLGTPGWSIPERAPASNTPAGTEAAVVKLAPQAQNVAPAAKQKSEARGPKAAKLTPVDVLRYAGTPQRQATAIDAFLQQYSPSAAAELAQDAAQREDVNRTAWQMLDVLQDAGRGRLVGRHYRAHRYNVSDEALLARLQRYGKEGSSRFSYLGGAALLRLRQEALRSLTQLPWEPGTFVVYLRDDVLGGSGFTCRSARDQVEPFFQSNLARFVVQRSLRESASKSTDFVAMYPVPADFVGAHRVGIWSRSAAPSK